VALTPAGRKMRDDMYTAVASDVPVLGGPADVEFDTL
jgi:hypothetical protein